jgi:hypothetical protein
MLRKLIEEEKIGLVSDSRDMQEVVRHILFLAQNPIIRRQMVKSEERFIRD